MHPAFWTGFEKLAMPSPGGTLDYALIRAQEIAKKRAKAGPTINYATLPKVPGTGRSTWRG